MGIALEISGQYFHPVSSTFSVSPSEGPVAACAEGEEVGEVVTYPADKEQSPASPVEAVTAGHEHVGHTHQGHARHPVYHGVLPGVVGGRAVIPHHALTQPHTETLLRCQLDRDGADTEEEAEVEEDPDGVEVAEEEGEADQPEADVGEEEGEADQEGDRPAGVSLIEPHRGDDEVDEAHGGGEALQAVAEEVSVHVRHVHHLGPDGGLEHRDQGEGDEGEGGEQGLDKPRGSDDPAESAVVLALELPVDDEEVDSEGVEDSHHWEEENGHQQGQADPPSVGWGGTHHLAKKEYYNQESLHFGRKKRNDAYK